jgi:hypothetical protein
MTTLSPRQIVTPAPYAMRALSENFMPLSDGVTLINTSPTTRVTLNRTSPVLASEVLSATVPTGNATGGIIINHADTTGTPYLMFTTGAAYRALLTYEPATSSVRLSTGITSPPALNAATVGAEARVGVNLATPPTEVLEVAGTTAANGFRYRALQTRTLIVPPEAFHAENSANGVSYSIERGVNMSNGTSGALVAPLTLPDGAVITDLTFSFWDDSGADMTLMLFFRTLTAGLPGVMRTVSSSGASPIGRTATSTGSNPTGSGGVYSLRVTNSSTWSAFTSVLGVRVTYTVPAPD